MRGITKRFPGVLANDRVEFEAAAGEVHALLGENGAGKSTLSNILTGLYRPDDGEIFLNGRKVHFHAPRDALGAGICMVLQHFSLDKPLTVGEYDVLGCGRSLVTVSTADATARSLAALMVGRELAAPGKPRVRSVGEAVLELEGVWTQGDRGEAAVRGASLVVREGEIVAVAGVAGNGQRELAETIAGMRAPTAGSVRIGAKPLRGGDPRAAIAAGIAY